MDLTTAASALASALALPVSLYALFLSLRQEGDDRHLAFIARRTEVLTTFSRQITALKSSERELRRTRELASEDYRKAIEALIDHHQAVRTDLERLFGRVKNVDIDTPPDRSLRVNLELLASDEAVGAEGVWDLVGGARDLMHAARASTAEPYVPQWGGSAAHVLKRTRA